MKERPADLVLREFYHASLKVRRPDLRVRPIWFGILARTTRKPKRIKNADR